MSLLEQHLGCCLSAEDVAEYLRCDIATVYQHYRDLGGVKIGTIYKFFERNLVEVLSKVQQPVAQAPALQRVLTTPPKVAASRQRPAKSVPKPIADHHGLL